jgi:hypothetical protein
MISQRNWNACAIARSTTDATSSITSIPRFLSDRRRQGPYLRCHSSSQIATSTKNVTSRKLVRDEIAVKVKLALSLIGLLVASVASAATDATTGVSTVNNILTSTVFGGGDVNFNLANNSLSASCPNGFWIRATDAGATKTYAQVLASYQSGSPVMVYADTSTLWSGSSSATCLVYAVRNQ